MQISKYQNAKSLLNLSNQWSLKEFDELLKDVTRIGTKIPSSDYEESGLYPVIDQGKDLIAGYSNLEYPIQGEKIVFGDHTRILKYIDFDSFHIGADGVKVLENKMPDKVLTKYIFYYLSSVNIPNTGYNRHFKYLKEIVIPVPRIDIQLKLVNLFDQVKNLIIKRKSQIVALDDLTQSIFLEMFGDPKTNSMQLKEIQLKELLCEIKGGGTPSKKVAEYYIDGNIPWVTPKDMKSMFIDSSKIYITEEAVENSSANYIKENSLLMVIRSGILKRYLPIAINRTQVTLNQDMKALLPNKNKTNVEYLYSFFKLYQSVLLNKVRSVTADNLDFNDVKNVIVPVANLEEQNKFKEKFNNIQKNKAILEEQKILFERLYNSLLQNAFKGELF